MNKRLQVLKSHCKKYVIPLRFSRRHLALLDLACTHKSYNWRQAPTKELGLMSPTHSVQSGVQKIRSGFFHALRCAFVKRKGYYAKQRLSITEIRLITTAQNNEQLEFLGDSVLSMIITQYLMRRFPNKSEGFLSRVKSYAVSRNALYYVASQLQLHLIFTCDASVAQSLPLDAMQAPPAFASLGRSPESQIHAPLANAVEAVIGAIYISQGMNKTHKFIIKHFAPIINSVIEGTHHRDYKSMLQHYTQSTYGLKPIYSIVRVSGPQHEKKYTVTVRIENGDKTIAHSFNSNEAHNKKQAEQDAAKAACSALKVEENEVLF